MEGYPFLTNFLEMTTAEIGGEDKNPDEPLVPSAALPSACPENRLANQSRCLVISAGIVVPFKDDPAHDQFALSLPSAFFFFHLHRRLAISVLQSFNFIHIFFHLAHSLLLSSIQPSLSHLFRKSQLHRRRQWETSR